MTTFCLHLLTTSLTFFTIFNGFFTINYIFPIKIVTPKIFPNSLRIKIECNCVWKKSFNIDFLFCTYDWYTSIEENATLCVYDLHTRSCMVKGCFFHTHTHVREKRMIVKSACVDLFWRPVFGSRIPKGDFLLLLLFCWVSMSGAMELSTDQIWDESLFLNAIQDIFLRQYSCLFFMLRHESRISNT